MNASRLPSTLGLAFALTLMARATRAQDQSNIISQHGDALARSTSAQALVVPMPPVPPNTPVPVHPSGDVYATPSAPSAPVVASAAAPTAALTSPAPGGGAAPQSAQTAPAPSVLPESNDSSAGSSRRRVVLIIVGALIAIAMFLWDRRRKG